MRLPGIIIRKVVKVVGKEVAIGAVGAIFDAGKHAATDAIRKALEKE